MTWRFENPGGTNDTNNLQITELRGSGGVTNLITWTNGGSTIILITGNGLKEGSLATVVELGVVGQNRDLRRFDSLHERHPRSICAPTISKCLAGVAEAMTNSVEGSGAAAPTLDD